jgi:hypothetical protein
MGLVIKSEKHSWTNKSIKIHRIMILKTMYVNFDKVTNNIGYISKRVIRPRWFQTILQ